MTYRFVITGHFKKQLKSFKQKDRLIKDRLIQALEGFNREQCISIGKGVYKFRVASAGRGKSKGYRVYVFLIEVNGLLAPLCIYAKNEKENLTWAELAWHLEVTQRELIEGE